MPACNTSAPMEPQSALGWIPSCGKERLTPVDCAVKGHFSRSRRKVQVSSRAALGSIQAGKVMLL